MADYVTRMPDQHYEQCPEAWERTRISEEESAAGMVLGTRFRCMGPVGHPGRHNAVAEDWTAEGLYEPVTGWDDAMRSSVEDGQT